VAELENEIVEAERQRGTSGVDTLDLLRPIRISKRVRANARVSRIPVGLDEHHLGGDDVVEHGDSGTWPEGREGRPPGADEVAGTPAPAQGHLSIRAVDRRTRRTVSPVLSMKLNSNTECCCLARRDVAGAHRGNGRRADT